MREMLLLLLSVAAAVATHAGLQPAAAAAIQAVAATVTPPACMEWCHAQLAARAAAPPAPPAATAPPNAAIASKAPTPPPNAAGGVLNREQVHAVEEQAAQVLWDWMGFADEPAALLPPGGKADLIFVLGNQDLRTAEHGEFPGPRRWRRGDGGVEAATSVVAVAAGFGCVTHLDSTESRWCSRRG